MDRYVHREPRDCVQQQQQGRQIPGYIMHSENIITVPPPSSSVYSGGYSGVEAPINRSNTGYMSMSHLNTNSPYGTSNAMPAQGQTGSGIDPRGSGIDPRYLNTYSDGSAMYITGTAPQPPPQQRPNNDHMQMSHFAEDPYQSRQFVGPERMRNVKPSYIPQSPQIGVGSEALQRQLREQVSMNKTSFTSSNDYRSHGVLGSEHRSSDFAPQFPVNRGGVQTESSKVVKSFELPHNMVTNVPASLPASFIAEMEPLKKETLNPTKTRQEKLKALHNSGVRVFSGPVDKVVKWHKTLQDIGLVVLYEIVAKCVSVRPGERCAKNLVVRDENGPAMQVVYYEIDFLLPDLKPPCTVRVIGRMMPGTCRLQAFNVRTATGDDVATLPRRAAVASHHVAKLCKEYGPNSV